MLSVVIPIHNEEENIEPLYAELTQTLRSIGQSSEMLFVDDGSYDGSYRCLTDLASRLELESGVAVQAFLHLLCAS